MRVQDPGTSLDAESVESAERALQKFEAYLDRRPHHGIAFGELRERLALLGRGEAWSQELEERLASNPGDRGARVLLARWLEAEGDAERAIALLGELADPDPQDDRLLGAWLLGANRGAEAVAPLGRAARGIADLEERMAALRDLADAHQVVGDSAAAEQVLLELGGDPGLGFPGAIEVAAELGERGLVDGALTQFERALTMAGEDPERVVRVLSARLPILVVADRYDEALADGERAITLLARGHWRMDDLLGAVEDIHRRRSTRHEYARACRDAVATNPSDALSLERAGRILGLLQRFEEQLDVLRVATKAYPKDRGFSEMLRAALIEQGDVDGWIAETQRFLEVSPWDEALLRKLGETLAIRGLEVEAKRVFASSWEGRELDGREWVRHAEMYGRLGFTQDAEELWDRAMGANPGDVGIVIDRGECLLDQGRFLDLDTLLVSAEGTFGEDAASLSEIAGLWGRADRGERALEVQGRAVGLHPEVPEWRWLLGSLADEQGELELALGCFEAVVDLVPRGMRSEDAIEAWVRCHRRHRGLIAALEEAQARVAEEGEPGKYRGGAHRRMAALLSALGRGLDAEGIWLEILRREPEATDAAVALAQGAQARGELELAGERWWTVIQDHPAWRRRAEVQRARVLISVVEPDRARAMHRGLLRGVLEGIRDYEIVSDGLARLGDFDGALEALDRGLEVSPTNRRLLDQRIRLLESTGDLERTLEGLEGAARRGIRSERRAAAERYYGRLLLEGRLEARIAALQEAYGFEPGNAELGDLLVDLYLQDLEWGKALSIVDQRLRVEPNSAALGIQRGSLLARMGQEEEARTQFVAVLKGTQSLGPSDALDLVDGLVDVGAEGVIPGHLLRWNDPSAVASRLAARERVDSALTLLMAWEHSGASVGVVRLRAEILHRAGRRRAAIAALETACEEEPDDVILHRRLGGLYKQIKNRGGVERVLRAIFEAYHRTPVIGVQGGIAGAGAPFRTHPRVLRADGRQWGALDVYGELLLEHVRDRELEPQWVRAAVDHTLETGGDPGELLRALEGRHGTASAVAVPGPEVDPKLAALEESILRLIEFHPSQGEGSARRALQGIRRLVKEGGSPQQRVDAWHWAIRQREALDRTTTASESLGGQDAAELYRMALRDTGGDAGLLLGATLLARDQGRHAEALVGWERLGSIAEARGWGSPAEPGSNPAGRSSSSMGFRELNSLDWESRGPWLAEPRNSLSHPRRNSLGPVGVDPWTLEIERARCLLELGEVDTLGSALAELMEQAANAPRRRFAVLHLALEGGLAEERWIDRFDSDLGTLLSDGILSRVDGIRREAGAVLVQLAKRAGNGDHSPEAYRWGRLAGVNPGNPRGYGIPGPTDLEAWNRLADPLVAAWGTARIRRESAEDADTLRRALSEEHDLGVLAGEALLAADRSAEALEHWTGLAAEHPWHLPVVDVALDLQEKAGDFEGARGLLLAVRRSQRPSARNPESAFGGSGLEPDLPSRSADSGFDAESDSAFAAARNELGGTARVPGPHGELRYLGLLLERDEGGAVLEELQAIRFRSPSVFRALVRSATGWISHFSPGPERVELLRFVFQWGGHEPSLGHLLTQELREAGDLEGAERVLGLLRGTVGPKDPGFHRFQREFRLLREARFGPGVEDPLAELRGAVAESPADMALRIDLAQELWERRAFADSLAVLREARQRAPKHAGVLDLLGRRLGESGRLAELRDLLEERIEAGGGARGRAALARQLAHFEWREGDANKAHSRVEPVPGPGRAKVEYADWIAWCLDAGDLRGAAEAAEGELESNGGAVGANPKDLVRLGRLWLAAGEPLRAVDPWLLRLDASDRADTRSLAFRRGATTLRLDWNLAEVASAVRRESERIADEDPLRSLRLGAIADLTVGDLRASGESLRALAEVEPHGEYLLPLRVSVAREGGELAMAASLLGEIEARPGKHWASLGNGVWLESDLLAAARGDLALDLGDRASALRAWDPLLTSPGVEGRDAWAWAATERGLDGLAIERLGHPDVRAERSDLGLRLWTVQLLRRCEGDLAAREHLGELLHRLRSTSVEPWLLGSRPMPSAEQTVLWAQSRPPEREDWIRALSREIRDGSWGLLDDSRLIREVLALGHGELHRELLLELARRGQQASWGDAGWVLSLGRSAPRWAPGYLAEAAANHPRNGYGRMALEDLVELLPSVDLDRVQRDRCLHALTRIEGDLDTVHTAASLYRAYRALGATSRLGGIVDRMDAFLDKDSSWWRSDLRREALLAGQDWGTGPQPWLATPAPWDAFAPGQLSEPEDFDPESIRKEAEQDLLEDPGDPRAVLALSYLDHREGRWDDARDRLLASLGNRVVDREIDRGTFGALWHLHLRLGDRGAAEELGEVWLDMARWGLLDSSTDRHSIDAVRRQLVAWAYEGGDFGRAAGLAGHGRDPRRVPGTSVGGSRSGSHRPRGNWARIPDPRGAAHLLAGRGAPLVGAELRRNHSLLTRGGSAPHRAYGLELVLGAEPERGLEVLWHEFLDPLGEALHHGIPRNKVTDTRKERDYGDLYLAHLAGSSTDVLLERLAEVATRLRPSESVAGVHATRSPIERRIEWARLGLLHRHRRWNQLEPLLLAALARKPDSIALRRMWVDLLAGRGNRDEAIELQRTLVAEERERGWIQVFEESDTLAEAGGPIHFVWGVPRAPVRPRVQTRRPTDEVEVLDRLRLALLLGEARDRDERTALEDAALADPMFPSREGVITRWLAAYGGAGRVTAGMELIERELSGAHAPDGAWDVDARERWVSLLARHSGDESLGERAIEIARTRWAREDAELFSGGAVGIGVLLERWEYLLDHGADPQEFSEDPRIAAEVGVWPALGPPHGNLVQLRGLIARTSIRRGLPGEGLHEWNELRRELRLRGAWSPEGVEIRWALAVLGHPGSGSSAPGAGRDAREAKWVLGRAAQERIEDPVLNRLVRQWERP